MSRNRFIWMDGKDVPPIESIATEVHEYLGDLGKLEWTNGLCIFNLPGEFTKFGETSPRWVELFSSTKSIIVMTREMDGPTNDIADGIARLLARKYKGRLEASDLPLEIPIKEKET